MATDYTDFTTPLRLDSSSGQALVTKLSRRAPKRLSKRAAAALAAAVTAGEALAAEVAKRARAPKQRVREMDLLLDAAWSSLHGRLVAWETVSLPGTEKDVARAKELRAGFFPDGLSFLRLEAEDEYFKSHELLSRLKDETLRADVERLVGAVFVQQVEHWHAALGEVLDLRGELKQAAPDSRGIADALAAVSSAVATYARIVVGEIDEDDAPRSKRLVAALQPITKYRATRGRSALEEDVDEDVDAGDEDDDGGGDGDGGTGGGTVTKPVSGPKPPIKPGFPGGDPFEPGTDESLK